MMPIVHAIVPEADSHVYMPVLQQVAHHLVNSINIQDLIKNNIIIETGWTVPKGTRKNHTFYTRTNTLKITAEQSSFLNPVFEYQSFEFAPGYRADFGDIAKTHYYPLIADDTSEIYLWESKLPTSFTLNCTWWFQSRNTAYEVVKRMFYRFTQGEIYSLSVTYDYPLPKNIVEALFALYKKRKFDYMDPVFSRFLREGELSRELTFADWLSVVAKARFVQNKHRARKDKELCISKYIDNGLIQVDMDTGKPEEIKINNVPEVYSINFSVKIQFEESSAVVLKYPVIIDSQMLGREFIPLIRHNDTPVASQWPRYSNPLWDGVYHIHSAIHQFPNGTVKIPYYDDWKVPWNDLANRSYRHFFVSLYSRDEDKDVIQLDLKKPLYEDLCLEPFVLEVLKAQLTDSFRDDVIFSIASYARERQQAFSDMNLSEDLILTIKSRDIHPQKHLVFYELKDFRYLNPKWYWILYKYPEQFGLDTPSGREYIYHITGGQGAPSGWLKDSNNYSRTIEETINGTVRTIRTFRTALRPSYPSSR